MTRIPGWLRRLRQAIPLLRSHVGRHIDAFLDLDWADQLHGMRERRARNRPVYTPPARQTIAYNDLDCFQPDPRLALELHHEPHRDVVAATLHNPGLLDDIRAERTRNLAGPVEQGQGHRAGEPATNVAMGNWRRRELAPAALTEDTTVDMSLHAAIRNDVDGDYTGQIIDRYFSQINLSKIFADLGLTYTRTGAPA